MKKIDVSVLLFCLIYTSFIQAQEWRSECAGYYNFNLPDDVEIALYPLDLILNPMEDAGWRKEYFSSRYLFPRISFGDNRYQDDNDRVQAQFSGFYYRNYKLNISSQGKEPIDFKRYQKQYIDRLDSHKKDYLITRAYEESIKIDVISKEKVDEMFAYQVVNYSDAFSVLGESVFSLFVNKDNRLFIFNTANKLEALNQDKSINISEAGALYKKFQPRNLYEVPKEQGFCLPYGFIAGDSGHEKRNMAVTYRLKEHPDVTIFFQDLGTSPGPGERRPDESMDAKRYVTHFWTKRYGHAFREMQLNGKGFSSPKVDNRKGVAAFTRFIRRSKEVDYGYMAFVKGNSDNNEPDLIFYVVRDSRQAKGHPPMDKDKLEKMAEHIISTVKHR